MANFVYVLVDEKSKEGLVVDSGWETGPIKKAIDEFGAEVKYAVATHEHFDHTSTLRALTQATGGKVVVHESSPIEGDIRVTDGEKLLLGRRELKVIHTPGHTEDSICVFDGNNLFTGDTLFVGTIGKFDRLTSESMYRSLREVIWKLPDKTIIYPGHDYGEVPFRSLGEEKATNPFLMTRDFRAFASLFA